VKDGPSHPGDDRHKQKATAGAHLLTGGDGLGFESRSTQDFGFIRLLSRKSIVGAAEVTERRRLLVDRPAKL
jgi:hypothetical protein